MTATTPAESAGVGIGSLTASYARLPERFYARVAPTRVASPGLIRVNRPLAAELGLDLERLDPTTLAAVFSGNLLPEGAEPVAMAYAGHQFGHFVPQLGDGRAILLGEAHDRRGQRRDLHLKGSGRTPFSRAGDGRAALGPVLREYVVSEAMHALGIPTTRALAAVTTGETILREGPVPGAVFTRVAASHVRVGTFQYLAVRDDVEGVRILADHAIERHYPELAGDADRYLALIAAVGDRHARLVARWLAVGFVHGVMNTDNVAVSGETIDFGPCAFLDAYSAAAVFSSIDHRGRYAYANQPLIAQWNLARFAETLLPLIDPDPARAVERATGAVNGFAELQDAHWLAAMASKVGIRDPRPEDRGLIDALLDVMEANQADFTLTFRALCDAAAVPAADDAVRALFASPGAYDAWAVAWRARLAADGQPAADRARRMRTVNPAYVPRNHRVEEVIRAAVDHGDFRPFEHLVAVLARPFEEQEGNSRYAAPPQPHERVLQTFCGT